MTVTLRTGGILSLKVEGVHNQFSIYFTNRPNFRFVTCLYNNERRFEQGLD